MENRNPFFEVERKKLFTTWDDPAIENQYGSGMGRMTVPVNRDALINKETGDIVGVVSPKYKFVHNRDLADKIDQMIYNLPVDGMEDHMDARTTRWTREIMLTGDQFEYDMTGNSDIVKTKLSFFNGYDGKTAAGWKISAWRKVCSNGMMGWRALFGMTFTHLTEDIIERFNKLFIEKNEAFGEQMIGMRAMARTPFSRTQYETFVLTRNIPDRTASRLLQYYEPAMNKWGEQETKWGAYNVLTAFATHETKARKGSYIFSASYQQMDQVARELIDFRPDEAEYGELRKIAYERYKEIVS